MILGLKNHLQVIHFVLLVVRVKSDNWLAVLFVVQTGHAKCRLKSCSKTIDKGYYRIIRREYSNLNQIMKYYFHLYCFHIYFHQKYENIKLEKSKIKGKKKK